VCSRYFEETVRAELMPRRWCVGLDRNRRMMLRRLQRPLLTKTMSRLQVNVAIPSGQGEICLVTGVTDGGRFAVCSGMLACG